MSSVDAVAQPPGDIGTSPQLLEPTGRFHIIIDNFSNFSTQNLRVFAFFRKKRPLNRKFFEKSAPVRFMRTPTDSRVRVEFGENRWREVTTTIRRIPDSENQWNCVASLWQQPSASLPAGDNNITKKAFCSDAFLLRCSGRVQSFCEFIGVGYR